MAKSEAQKKRERDQRAKKKAHHWLIVHHPWHRNHYRNSSSFLEYEVQDIAWFIGMVLNCPWRMVDVVQYHMNKKIVIVKVDLSVDISSKLGQYDWIDFLRQRRSGDDGEATKIFEYNFIEFGDQSDKQWKEYFPPNRPPPVDFPIDSTHRFSAPKWCQRPSYEPVKWTIPIPEPLDLVPTSQAQHSGREVSIFEDDPRAKQQSPPTLDTDHSVKRESTLNSALMANGHHNTEDNKKNLSPEVPNYDHNPVRSFATNSQLHHTPQLEHSAAGFHPYEPPSHYHPFLGSSTARPLNVAENNIPTKFENPAQTKYESCGPGISRRDDSQSILSRLQDEPDTLDLCYPDDDENQNRSDHWITIKNPYGIRWKGKGLPEFVEIWDWLQLFADGALELYADLLQQNVVVRLSGSVDLNGILGRHVWKDMLKEFSHPYNQDTFSLVIPCTIKELDGLVKVEVSESKEDYSKFVEPYPLPLSFTHESEDKKQISVKTEDDDLKRAGDASRSRDKENVEEGDEKVRKRGRYDL